MEINNKYNLGQMVYLYTDPDQLPRMIIGIKIDISRSLLYKICCGTSETWHFEAEISSNKNIDIALGINSN